MSQVTIYFAEVCGLCHKAMDWMRERKIPFDTREIVYDSAKDEFVDSENTRDMYARCGGEVEFVPQIFIGDHHVPGYRSLEPLIESGEVFRLLEGAGIPFEGP